MPARCHVETARRCAAYSPDRRPESDGTLAWDKTTLVLVEATAGGETGLGYTYADAATAPLIRDAAAPGSSSGRDAHGACRGAWSAMVAAVRNLGRAGHRRDGDLGGRHGALGSEGAAARPAAGHAARRAPATRSPVYGSGGFTSYSIDAAGRRSSAAGSQAGIPRVKMKIGRDPAADLARVARRARGHRRRTPSCSSTPTAPTTASRRCALAERFAELGVALVRGAGLLRRPRRAAAAPRPRARPAWRSPPGEYGYDLPLLPPHARGRGGRRAAGRRHPLRRRSPASCAPAALCERARLPLSAHCAPSLHAHLGCALPASATSNISTTTRGSSSMLFDGALMPVQGCCAPMPAAPAWASSSSAGCRSAAQILTLAREAMERLKARHAGAPGARAAPAGAEARPVERPCAAVKTAAPCSIEVVGGARRQRLDGQAGIGRALRRQDAAVADEEIRDVLAAPELVDHRVGRRSAHARRADQWA